MKTIFFFCIPAHGHTNPMLPVAAELVKRGNLVRFYSFGEFRDRISATGAEFISCDEFLPALTEEEEKGLRKVSTTEMTIQDIRITLAMDSFLDAEFDSFRPDVVYTDSVCFWGKLNAWKHEVPMVVSTSTFAFNQLSSQYMKNSPGEMADMILGLPRVSKELKKLEPYGYHVKGVLSLISNDNQTDTVVYTSKRFQPFSESFSDHYIFTGPSVFSDAFPDKIKERPLVYVSLGTVINDRPDFYKKCIEALGETDLDVIISCGNTVDPETLGKLPGNVRVYPRVDQLGVLSAADVFITHCGMNSVSESLYMETPMVLCPTTGEQKAVARRVAELGAGMALNDGSVGAIRDSVREILENATYREAAEACGKDLRSCPGPAGAAEFIEAAPHQSNAVDVIAELNKKSAVFQFAYWAVIIAVINLAGILFGWKYVWIIGLAAGILSGPVGKAVQKRRYEAILRKIRQDAQ